MDDMLEPNDAAEIRKKVEESQFASDLLQRTRTVTGRMRLGAPKVAGRGMGVDANTVSEYLDHVLDADRVQEFEKVCLEADVHLAEVAACHQILALVLGEPATVDPTARDRMYRLKSLRHDKSHSSEAAAAATTAATTGQAAAEKTADKAPAKTEPREKPEVPEYLRDRRSTPVLSVAATILVAALIGVGMLMIFDKDNPISRWLGGGEPVAVDDSNRPSNDDPEEPLVPAPDDTPDAPGPVVPTPDEPGPEEPTEPVTPPDDPKKPDGPEHIRLPGPGESIEDPPKKPEIDNPDKGLIDDPGKKPDDPGKTPDDPGPKEPVDDGPTKPEVDPKTPEPAANGPVEIGRYLSDNQLLIRYDAKANDWFQVPARASLKSGERVIALPTYRPTLTLSAGVTLQVPGGSSLELLPPDKDGTAGVRLNYGRLVMLNNGAVGTRFRIALGDGKSPREGVVTFAGPASTAAIQVSREAENGKNPEDAKTPLVAELCAAGGQIVWQEPAAKISEEIDPKTHLEMRSDSAVKRIPNSAMFNWLETDELSKRDRLASPELRKGLEPGRSMVLSLKELAAHRRVEVRSLARRSLGHLGYFESLINAFDDPEQRSHWLPYYASLREALTRGPVAAAQVREALERQRSGEAAGLYRMLWGYSDEQLAGGAASELVEDLLHDDLDYRVLAFLSLSDITGVTLLYRPDDSTLKRRQPCASLERETRVRRDQAQALVFHSANPPSAPPPPSPKADNIRGVS